jgi:hypothetical protein
MQRLVAACHRLRGEVRSVSGGPAGPVLGQDDTVAGRMLDRGDAGPFVKLRLEIVELANVVVGGAAGGRTTFDALLAAAWCYAASDPLLRGSSRPALSGSSPCTGSTAG